MSMSTGDSKLPFSGSVRVNNVCAGMSSHTSRDYSLPLLYVHCLAAEQVNKINLKNAHSIILICKL